MSDTRYSILIGLGFLWIVCIVFQWSFSLIEGERFITNYWLLTHYSSLTWIPSGLAGVVVLSWYAAQPRSFKRLLYSQGLLVLWLMIGIFMTVAGHLLSAAWQPYDFDRLQIGDKTYYAAYEGTGDLDGASVGLYQCNNQGLDCREVAHEPMPWTDLRLESAHLEMANNSIVLVRGSGTFDITMYELGK